MKKVLFMILMAQAIIMSSCGDHSGNVNDNDASSIVRSPNGTIINNTDSTGTATLIR
jgi:hypothetical protein